MADTGNDFQKRLQALRDSYTAQLPAKIDEIKTLWQRLVAEQKPEDMKTLHRLVHSLTGSGATFGYEQLSKVSRVLENCLKEVVEQGKTMDGSCQQRIDDYLKEVESVASSGRSKAQHEPELKFKTSSADHENRLIYLVEDDALQAQDLALQLRHFGYDVRIFSEPGSMKEAYHKQLPAAVIMDIMFPEGDLAGTEIITSLKRGCEAPPPVLFVSSRDDIEARLEAVRACGDGYFTKPVEVSTLVDTLDRLTARKLEDNYRILIVDDDVTLCDHYALTLRKSGMEVTTLNRSLAVMDALATSKPDLILIDLYMPECDGLELAAVLRQQPDYLSIPIVFLTTEVDSDVRAKAMQLGADDFLNKPILPAHLVAAVSSRAQRARALRSYMIRDSLTGLLNHSTTKDYLETEFTRAQRQNWTLSFAMLDLDHFKIINDTHGHACGDRVLKSLARMLQQRLRHSDIIGRVGGEEFAVIFMDTDAATAQRVMNEIRGDFAAIRHYAEGGEFSATFSCGIATRQGCHDSVQLYQAADRALYTAKHNGRNQVILNPS